MDCKAPVSGRRGFRSVMAPIGASALAAVLALSCLGCSAAAPDAREDAAEAAAQEVLRANIDAMDFEYTKRDLDGSYDGSQAVVLDLAAGTVEGGGASYDSRDSLFSIEAEGTYLLQGAAEDVQVKVAVGKEEKVQLVLDGASLAASQRPALLVEEADKVFVTLAEGSQNSIAGGQADEGDSPLNGAVYSKADITFNGSGALAVEGQGQNCHAIASKDDLVITGGTYDLKAPGNGLHGKDCVKVCGGAFSIAVEGDGVRSSNDEDAARGFIAIDGGDFSIEAGDDGFDAQRYFRVTDGAIDLTAADDGFHSESDGAVQGGFIDLRAGDDAFHSEYLLSIDGGTVTVRDCAEGYEAQEVYLNGGASVITAQDDAVNASAAGESSSTGAAGTPDGVSKGAAPGAQEGCILQVNGGKLTVYAGGDGLDSNGSLQVNDGTVLVSGPASGADGALDYETEATVNGGTVLALGPAAMASGFTGGTQGSALVQFQGAAGETVVLTASDGTVLAEFAPANAYQTAVVSSAALALGDGFTLSSGGSSTQGTVAETSAGTGQGGPGDRGRGGAFGEEGGQGPAAPQGQGGPRDGGGSQRPQDMPEPPDGGDGFGEMQPPEGGEGGPGGPRSQEDGAAPQSREADATARGSAGSGEETIQA